MGLSTKNFIFDEESGNLRKISNTKFEKLFKGNPDASLKEYSDSIVKYITVIVRNENRKPVEITNIQYGILKIDKNGRIDAKFSEEMQRDAMAIVNSYLFTEGQPENVIGSLDNFAAKIYKDKYTWTPSPELEEKIKEEIFGKPKYRKLSEIIIEIAEVGYKKKKYIGSELMHLLMFLAHVAWNRDTRGTNYLTGAPLLKQIQNFPVKEKRVKKELISSDWEEIISEMLKYKRKHFPDDLRKITQIGYTTQETLRVIWEV